MKHLTKTQFVSAINTYCKDKKELEIKDINKVVNRILKEEERNFVISHVNDGSRQLSLFDDDFLFDINSQTQNLFFYMVLFISIKMGNI